MVLSFFLFVLLLTCRENTIILVVLFTSKGKWQPCILENYCRDTFARTRPHISLLSLGRDGRVESLYEDNYQSIFIDALIKILIHIIITITTIPVTLC